MNGGGYIHGTYCYMVQLLKNDRLVYTSIALLSVVYTAIGYVWIFIIK